MKTIGQMKQELKDKIDKCKLVDYEMIETKGLIGIRIITKDFEKYKKRRMINPIQN